MFFRGRERFFRGLFVFFRGRSIFVFFVFFRGQERFFRGLFVLFRGRSTFSCFSCYFVGRSVFFVAFSCFFVPAPGASATSGFSARGDIYIYILAPTKVLQRDR